MYIDYTPEQKALKQEIRTYMADLMTPELEDELHGMEAGGPLYHAALQKMGADGWLGIGWKKEYGGQGRSPIEEFIFYDEVQRAGFPVPFLTLTTVGPTLAKYGSDAQRAQFLGPILAGKVHFAIGYTEPGAGTDLAGLRTTAVRDGDEYVINGQKIFTSLANFADYLWLAAKTDPDKKHDGISVLIVPMNAEGVEQTRIRTLGDNQTSAVYLNNVRVPAENIVLGENKGWKLVTSQLNHERVALNPVGPIARFLTELQRWAKQTTTPSGERVIDRPWVRHNLAELYAQAEIVKLMNWQQAWKIQQRELSPADASALKVYGSEFFVRAYRAMMEILGAAGPLKLGEPGAALQGRIETYYRSILVLTFGGGTNEVQRDIIAMMGLGMPRPPYGQGA
ncbi:MAG: acyl-CoA dehydrogenase [Candidatus Dadabacteria bacterium]|nr:MAG: acyl-CoA dehydrogenase [Candidatus Dadabacteria bacterium]